MLQQLNVTYSTDQDRLLLKVREDDGTEYRVWLTRRFTALLCKVMQALMAELGGQDRLAASDQIVEQLKTGAFDAPYTTAQPPALPLGEDGILAHRINYQHGEHDTVALQLLPREGQGLNLSLSKHMLYMFYNLLEQCLPQTAWNLDELKVPRQLLH